MLLLRASFAHSPLVGWRNLSSHRDAKQMVKTGVVLLNMGGPSSPEETPQFLKRIFSDVDIMDFGGGKFQDLFGDLFSKLRTSKVQKQYEAIGGSPISHWTTVQGNKMVEVLDEIHPESAPHKVYPAFRYVHPYAENALQDMLDDGVSHAIAFSQYPQWSCTTTGSSINELWRQLKKMELEAAFTWSIIDRWPVQQGFLDAISERMMERLLEYDVQERSKVVIIFSAHSIPMSVVAKGDSYISEVAATVNAAAAHFATKIVGEGKIEGLSSPPRHVISWQSKVGASKWMVPSTRDVLEGLGKKKAKHVIVVPIAFTSDHVETLYEIGIEYAEFAGKVGITNMKYTEGLNGSPLFSNALASMVVEHFAEKKNYSSQYKMKCIGCIKPFCKRIVNPHFKSL
jgi:ferrochelatase